VKDRGIAREGGAVEIEEPQAVQSDPPPGFTGTPANQTQDQVPVLIALDRHGSTTDAVMADKSAASIAAVLAPAVVKDAVLVSDGAHAYRSFAARAGILHIGLIVTQGERTRGVYHRWHFSQGNTI
jgi:hypothetical protein